MTEKQEKSGALPSDRAAGLRPQPPSASSQSSIPSADSLSAGYEAWERGEPFDKFQYESWQEGWFVGFHGTEWKALAEAMGARCIGYSYDRAATFGWPSGFVCEISGDLNRHLRTVHAQAIETRRAETREAGFGAKHESAVGEADAPEGPTP